jgi:hypothetical protein
MPRECRPDDAVKGNKTLAYCGDAYEPRCVWVAFFAALPILGIPKSPTNEFN